ncbi:MAG: sulfotransferase [Planctomycetaceae bacterium]|nr:MAG: sulfotransferase [Planctomycetaceae bacterium]
MHTTGGRWKSRVKTLLRRIRARLLPVYVEHHTRLIPPLDETAVCTQPIFVVGAHRSGTTLLRRILDSHPHIACPPESQFMLHFFQLVTHERAMRGLRDMGFHPEEAIALLRRSAAQFHEMYRRAKGKPRWADKTPEYVSFWSGMYKLFGECASFIIMFRHPLDVAMSRWMRLMHLVRPPQEHELFDICAQVRDAQEQQLNFLEQLHADRRTYYVIFYEELVAQPREILQGMCRFLNEPWDEALLHHDEQPHDHGMEDPIVRVTRGFRPSHGNWRAWSPAQRRIAEEILSPMLDRLGYSADEITRQPTPLIRSACRSQAA